MDNSVNGSGGLTRGRRHFIEAPGEIEAIGHQFLGPGRYVRRRWMALDTARLNLTSVLHTELL